MPLPTEFVGLAQKYGAPAESLATAQNDTPEGHAALNVVVSFLATALLNLKVDTQDVIRLSSYLPDQFAISEEDVPEYEMLQMLSPTGLRGPVQFR